MLMYDRNVNDKTGLEPCQLYDAVQFMMYDTDMSGTVSVDETMTMLYQRYGKKKLETELQRLFGNTLQAEDGIGELSFQQYVVRQCVFWFSQTGWFDCPPRSDVSSVGNFFFFISGTSQPSR